MLEKQSDELAGLKFITFDNGVCFIIYFLFSDYFSSLFGDSSPSQANLSISFVFAVWFMLFVVAEEILTHSFYKIL